MWLQTVDFNNKVYCYPHYNNQYVFRTQHLEGPELTSLPLQNEQRSLYTIWKIQSKKNKNESPV